MDWKRLRFRPAPSADSAPRTAALSYPLPVELVPGELKAAIHLHSVERNGDAIPCWSYVTEGLAGYGQREMIFTLVRQPGEVPEDYPREPLWFFQTLLDLSKQGRTVGIGDFSRLGGHGLLGFYGIAYIQPVWAPQGGTPANWLAMIGLTEEEVTALQEFGSTRVLSILGKAEQFYPAPYWTERNRPSRISPDWKDSFLSRVTRFGIPGFRVFREENRIVLRACAGAAEVTMKALRSLPPDAPVALLTQIDPSADGTLVWQPGQIQAHAITPPGSQGRRLSGSFVLFIPEQEADGEQLLEDGYVLHLMSPSWQRLRSAMLAKENLRTPVFELRWIPDGFEEYLPRPGIAAATQQSGRVGTRSITLLQTDVEITAAITVEAFVGFEKSVEETVDALFARLSGKGELRVIIEVQRGGKASYELATRSLHSTMKDATLQQLWENLQECPVPEVKKPVRFAVEFETGD